MKHLITIAAKIYDGPNDGYYKFSYRFTEPFNLVIFERDFRKNYFDGLEALMNTADFNQLLKEGSFKKPIGPFGDYKGSDGLELNYFISQNILYVFASGEYQPSRYKIYFEGAWILNTSI